MGRVRRDASRAESRSASSSRYAPSDKEPCGAAMPAAPSRAAHHQVVTRQATRSHAELASRGAQYCPRLEPAHVGPGLTARSSRWAPPLPLTSARLDCTVLTERLHPLSFSPSLPLQPPAGINQRSTVSWPPAPPASARLPSATLQQPPRRRLPRRRRCLRRRQRRGCRRGCARRRLKWL
jgi:hypothetical protein